MFSGNIFGGTFNIDIVEPSMKKKIPSSKKALVDDMTQAVNKCVKLKSKLQLKCFIVLKSHSLKSVIYFSVSTHRINCIDQGQ